MLTCYQTHHPTRFDWGFFSINRYTVDEFPLYDSAEDEPLDKVNKVTDSTIREASITLKTEYAGLHNNGFEYKYKTNFTGSVGIVRSEAESNENAMVVSGLRNNIALGDFNNRVGHWFCKASS